MGLSDVDSDPDPATGETGDLVIDAGTQIHSNIDAGFYLLASIGNYVWEDTNGDGIQDIGEGIGGVDVTLEGETGAGEPVSLPTTSNAGGFYDFTNIVVPGSYTLTFIAGGDYLGTLQDFGGDDNNDSDADPSTGETVEFQIFSDESTEKWDAGFYLPATVGNYVWEDKNADGLQDGDEDGIEGVDVTLTCNTGIMNGQTFNTTTDIDGLYEFTDLAPGNYTLNFATPGGYNPTVQDAGGDAIDSDASEANGDTDPFDLESDQVFEDMDAGFYQFATIGDLAWEDINGNGIQDGEPGAGGISVTLDGVTGSGAAVTDNTTTDGAGNYAFDEVIPGTYHVTFDLGAYDGFTLQDQGGDDLSDSDADETTGETVDETVESGQNYSDFDCGLYKFVKVGNFCWEDMDANGIQDGGEPGLENISVSAIRASDGFTYMTNSDAAGKYSFDELTPGTYTFQFVGAGYIITVQNMGGPDNDSDPNDAGTTDESRFEKGGRDFYS